MPHDNEIGGPAKSAEETAILHALGLLEPQEAAEFKQSLQTDPDLVRMVSDFQETAAAVLAEEGGRQKVAKPERLKEGVLEHARQTPQDRFPKVVVSALHEAGFPPLSDDRAIVLASVAGIVGWVSPAFTKLSGYSLEEMRGRKPGTVLQGPGSHVSDIRSLGAAVRGRKPVVRNVLNYHKDGHPYFCEVDLRPFSSGFIAVERLIGKTLEV